MKKVIDDSNDANGRFRIYLLYTRRKGDKAMRKNSKGSTLAKKLSQLWKGFAGRFLKKSEIGFRS